MSAEGLRTAVLRISWRWSRPIAVLLAGAVISCATGADGEPREEGLEVVRGDTVLASLSMADIRRQPQATVEAGGQPQTGPTLRSVLAESGVEAFVAVTVHGMKPGRLMSGELTLTSAEVTDLVVLAINRQGKAKLASPSIPSERWIVDVTRLVVE